MLLYADKKKDIYNMEEKIKTFITKKELTHFKTENYSPPLLIAEFIDNSISSWEGNSKRNINGLEIDILFEEKEYTNNKKDFKITIKDNAEGISSSEIKNNTSQFYKTENKGLEDLNQHGIGLKSAIGWFGEDAIIYSKTSNEDFINTLDFNTSNFGNNDEWVMKKNDYKYDEEKHKKWVNNPGTTIIIEKVYYEDGQRFLYIKDEEHRNILLSFLGWKYRYYLIDGLIINIRYKNSDETHKEENYYVGPFSIVPWKLSDFFTTIKNSITNRLQEQNIEIEFALAKDKFLQSIKDIQYKEDANSTCYQICTLILQDKPVELIKEIEINNKKYDLKLGIISSNKGKMHKHIISNSKINENNNLFSKPTKNFDYNSLQGVSTFHHNRGIDIGPGIEKNRTSKFPQTFSFASNRKSNNGKSTPIRLYGEIHLNDFRTETNKSNLFWEGTGIKDVFQDDLISIWKNDFEKILDKIIECENYKKEQKKMSEKDIEKVSNQNNFKMNQINYPPEYLTTEKGNHNWKYKFEHEKNLYTFSLVEEPLNNKPFECEQLGNTEYQINYDYNHAIWNPINKDNGVQARKLCHPIIIALALSQWLLDEKRKKITDSSQNINLFEIIDSIIKDWKPEDE